MGHRSTALALCLTLAVATPAAGHPPGASRTTASPSQETQFDLRETLQQALAP
jgi:hypothetical protein